MLSAVFAYNRAMRVIVKWLAIAFLSFHVFAIGLWNFPRGNVFQNSLRDSVRWYIEPLGQWQTWGMFTSAPNYQKVSVKLIALDRAGRTREYGAILPGLRSYHQTLRINSVFRKLLRKSRKPYLEAYAAKACREIRKRGDDFEVVSVRLQYDMRKLRNVYKIRKDGRISKEYKILKGPFAC